MSKKAGMVGLGLLMISCISITANAEQRVAGELKTKSGQEIGVTVSSYDYQEPSLNVSLKATKLGMDYKGAVALEEGWFIRGNFGYANGRADYSGSGTLSARPDWYYELRGMIGKDFDQGNYVISPYVGLGYRYLFNDLRGVSSTGASGYRRKSEYSYLPVGMTHQIKLESQAKLLTTLEYDHLISGQQTTYITDVTNLIADQVNKQRHGYGIRGSVYYEKGSWSFGPWFQYWNINQSASTTATVTLLGVTYNATFWEPKNKTTEIGLRFGYKF
ncbi:MAG: hypothetical protein Q7T38_06155 [Gallionella sp.]|nr:hypothetical protein [Gallionella sp.]